MTEHNATKLFQRPAQSLSRVESNCGIRVSLRMGSHLKLGAWPPLAMVWMYACVMCCVKSRWLLAVMAATVAGLTDSVLLCAGGSRFHSSWNAAGSTRACVRNAPCGSGQRGGLSTVCRPSNLPSGKKPSK